MSTNSDAPQLDDGHRRGTAVDRLIGLCLQNRLVVTLVLMMIVAWGVHVAPFDWNTGWFPRDPVPVDAIPDIGENQQIVFTEWTGRSPQDVEDQITYPLTVSLLGIPGVKTVRSSSMFGFSSIYVIFNEGVEFYWSRSRVLEKLNSLPVGMLPSGVQPALGPDATALGQVFWYTLEGQDQSGRPTGGWDLDELRATQDWFVRYALLSADGIAEVASVGGHVREYQVDVDPDAMRAYGVRIGDVIRAVRMSNIDVGARSIEVNNVEYFIRGLGFIDSIEDIEQSVVRIAENTPIRVKDVAHVVLGPALRRGALDKEGAEVVGGVCVVRYGENPLSAIKNVKRKIKEIDAGLPAKAVFDWSLISRSEVARFAEEQDFSAFENGDINTKAWLEWLLATAPDDRPPWVTYSKLTVEPFYDRSKLIYETLGTLNVAIYHEILITIIVVLIMVRHLSSSVLIAGLLPLAVLMTFIAMRYFGVDANVVALSGIAIAIGTMVDMGIVISENILRRLDESEDREKNAFRVVRRASAEVGGAVLTAVATTVVGFLPVFAMQAAEGKLFRPLAFTKTFALISAVIVALTVIPPFAHLLFTGRISTRLVRGVVYVAVSATGVALYFFAPWWAATIVLAIGIFKLFEAVLPNIVAHAIRRWSTWVLVVLVTCLLASDWLPLGPEISVMANILFVGAMIGGILFIVHLFVRVYARLLHWTLDHKILFLAIPFVLVLFGAYVWWGPAALFGDIPDGLAPLAGRQWGAPDFIREAGPLTKLKWTLARDWKGRGKEFMPPLDEGSYLFMPTTMPHASIGEALDVLQKQDMAMATIPEIDSVVGKLGRADSPLDPAPISMFETVVNYKPQYLVDRAGRRLRFKHDSKETDYFRLEDGTPAPAPDGEPYLVRGKFPRDENGRLIPNRKGAPFRLWRPELDPELNEARAPWPGIAKPDDIWKQIEMVTRIPGTTSAPRLQPIAARIVMLQSGMRAPMGVKVKGPDLDTIEQVGLQIERLLANLPGAGVRPETVVADRIVGKPYLEIDIDRKAIARHGIHIREVQDVIEVALGGKTLTKTVEGRERYPVRVRYMRELRDQIETLGQTYIPAPDGAQIPLTQLAEIRYLRGPHAIKSEDTRLVGYVVFDKKDGYAEVDVVEACDAYLKQQEESGAFLVPPGVSYSFAGTYENQLRAARTLLLVVPLALFVIFLILYLQFRSVSTSLLVFSGIIVAWAGGFLMIWLYSQPWVMDFSILGTNMRDLFQMHDINLSVAIWVGFLALFGIASDNGVIVATILDQRFAERNPDSIETIRKVTVEGAERRIRPALMTSATTILALLPILTSTGRGADIMIPMAIPSFGGMTVALVTVFVVPVLYCMLKEIQFKHRAGKASGVPESNSNPSDAG